jgi:hypothetical protein
VSTVDFEQLRADTAKEGKRLGWKPFGEAVGVDGETLRAFAMATDGRKPSPKTRDALLAYFYPSASVLRQKATRALSLIREGQELLQQVVHVVDKLPIDPDVAATIASADDPTPDETRRDAPPKKRRGGGAR